MVRLTSAEACDDVLEMLAPGDLFGDAGLQVWKHRFKCTWDLRFSDDGIFNDAEVMVLRNCVFDQGGII